MIIQNNSENTVSHKYLVWTVTVNAFLKNALELFLKGIVKFFPTNQIFFFCMRTSFKFSKLKAVFTLSLILKYHTIMIYILSRFRLKEQP